MQDYRKYILWVEDFAGDSQIIEEQENTNPYEDEIKENFPEYLHNHIHIIEDPATLPEHMQEHHSDYGLIILDVNFSDGLDCEHYKLDKLIFELHEAGVQVPKEFNLLPNPREFIENLGYYLYVYLRNKWNIPNDRIMFNSAYEPNLGNNRFLGINQPMFITKSKEFFKHTELSKVISKRFPDSINSLAMAIIKAKDILAYWLEKNPNGENSIFSRIARKKESNKINIDSIIKRIDSALNSSSMYADDNTNISLVLTSILSALSHPFESDIDYFMLRDDEKNRYEVTAFYAMKLVRNICAHRDYEKMADDLSVADFLFLFAFGMRILFDDFENNDALLGAEQWIVNHFRNEYEEKFIMELNIDFTANVADTHIKEILTNWYINIAKEAGSISSVNELLISRELRQKYKFYHIVHMLCIKAVGFKLNVIPNLYSNPSKNHPELMSNDKSPTLHCQIELNLDFDLRDSPGEYIMRFEESPLKTIAIEYICSKLEVKTKWPGPIGVTC